MCRGTSRHTDDSFTTGRFSFVTVELLLVRAERVAFILASANAREISLPYTETRAVTSYILES